MTECEHFSQAVEHTIPKTEGCEECEKEKLPWVAIRQCLTCGHVGCCDSSVGRHATKHFEESGPSSDDCSSRSSMEMVLYSQGILLNS